jgi:DNA-binding NarL/FixJ family response regulator
METLARRHSHARADATRVLLVAASQVRRTALSERLVKAFGSGPAEVTPRSSFVAGAATPAGIADIVMADLETPAEAAAMIRALQQEGGGAGAIALIDDPDPRWLRLALKAGINAIISREAALEELRLALAAADAGLVLLHPTSARNLITAHLPPPELSYQHEQLTAREQEVLRLLSDGLGNKEIATRLAISEHTAKFHISSILGKLGAATRTEAVTQGIKRGLIAI